MTVRCYVRAGAADLAGLDATGRLALAGLPTYAVTPALRRLLADGGPDPDEEECEYVALTLAAGPVEGEAGGPGSPRRVVLAVDLADTEVRADPDRPGVVEVAAEAVPLARVAALHVDPEPPTEQDDDLAWYAVQELAEVLVLLDGDPPRA